MPKTIGIIGGGQLGMMLTEASKTLSEFIKDVIVLDPTPNCPATYAGAKQICANYSDKDALRKLAQMTDIITYEIESGDVEELKSLKSIVAIQPLPETLEIIQDKFLQKEFLKKNNLPVPNFIKIDSLQDLKRTIKQFDHHALLKSRKGGYDGRGNQKITKESKLDQVFKKLGCNSLLLEEFIDFELEVSIIAARNTKGDICTYQLVENIHKDNILHTTIAPARVSENIAKKAKDVAIKTIKVLKGAGVFGIEMFVYKDEIIINEISPRVHNSGHHTLQSCQISQFEQHLRAILGLEVTGSELKCGAVMTNILGTTKFTGKYKPITIDDKDVFLKMYNKIESKPSRKLGHFTITDKKFDVDKLLEQSKIIQSNLSLEPV